MIKALTEKQLDKGLFALSGWQLNKKRTELTKAFEFSSFIAGLSFAAKIAVHAELLKHHPTLELTNTRVKVILTTASVKGLTKSDIELATRIEKLNTAK